MHMRIMIFIINECGINFKTIIPIVHNVSPHLQRMNHFIASSREQNFNTLLRANKISILSIGTTAIAQTNYAAAWRAYAAATLASIHGERVQHAVAVALARAKDNIGPASDALLVDAVRERLRLQAEAVVLMIPVQSVTLIHGGKAI